MSGNSSKPAGASPAFGRMFLEAGDIFRLGRLRDGGFAQEPLAQRVQFPDPLYRILTRSAPVLGDGPLIGRHRSPILSA